ncbi:MAG: 2,3-bisphosphoglycerate-independent phosphoglycerate mutase [Chloracidobacterium sp.]|nr:2,3-bisphosphoglycerate-independent phosphoglycerate mutase [Chloracidobacterium sp.]MCO5332768.1 2,3-bisphosphoglycerate-independent phosphoglycerate mutase [Pyrinomonadaceae bacterium]
MIDPQQRQLAAPVALFILDGWGFSPSVDGNAVFHANTPNYDRLCGAFPMTSIAAPGDAEEGHLDLGCGRSANSDDHRVRDALRNGEFETNQELASAIIAAKESGRRLHLIGLLSDGGVHSSIESLFAILRMARVRGLTDVFVHIILDGVDVAPRTADVYAEALAVKLADIGVGRIATICGRYFAMDSSGSWERTARAYTMLVHAEGERSPDAMAAIRGSFLRGIADEFIAPIVIEDQPGVPVATIEDGDSVIFYNHRPEGIRQLVRSLAVPDGGGLRKPSIRAVCLTQYDRAFELPVAFRSSSNNNVLTEVLANAGIASCKITQTERFPHLTYFFDGGGEIEVESDTQVLIPTVVGPSSDLRPESMSFKIADRFVREMEAAPRGIFAVNLPAAAIAARSGSMDRTVESIQFVDVCLGGMLDKIREAGGTAIVTASHGACEAMSNTDDASISPVNGRVPFHLVADSLQGTQLRRDGSLADVAPTLLRLLGLEVPNEMTGSDLRI